MARNTNPTPDAGPAHVYPHPRLRAGQARLIRNERQKPHRQRMEQRIMAALEELEDLRQEFLARLDLLQGDCDLEDDELESNLGEAVIWCDQRLPDECEADCEDEGADDDREPDAEGLCSWRSGEVDQRQPGPYFDTRAAYVDEGEESAERD